MSNALVREHLENVARSGGLTTYGDIAQIVNANMSDPADRQALATALDAVNDEEATRGNPMLTAVVVLAGTQRPGKGFFACAQRLGRTVGDDPQRFWLEELQRLRVHWTKDDNEEAAC